MRCWHCARDIDPQRQAPCFLPVSAGQSNDRWTFRGPGYFHNGHCMRAWLNDHLHGIPLDERYTLWANVRVYLREVYGYDRLPPPALPKECLEEFGGLYSWDEWMLECATAERADAWNLEDQLRQRPPSSQMCQPVALEHEKAPEMSLPKNLPGETNVLEAFISRLRKN